MKQFWRQYLKEAKAYFSGMGFYAFFAAYYILSYFSALYLGDYFLRESEIMNAYFTMQPIILVLIIPAVTMRSWAEEAKSGTLELLLTQPVGYFKLVSAKFFAAFSFFVLLLCSSFLLYALSAKLSVLDRGLTLSGYVGLLLCGALFTAVGCLISALNRNNILSYVLTIFVLFFWTQIEFTSFNFGRLTLPLRALNFEDNYQAWLTGSLKWSNLFYFISGICLCLWLNCVAVEYKITTEKKLKRPFALLTLLLLFIFGTSSLSSDLILPKTLDVTDEKKFTLTPQTEQFLNTLENRTDIVLYLSKNKREEANSAYAVYAEFVEKTLNLIAATSKGAVRVETVLVDAFSEQERKLVYEDKVFFEEDNLGLKTYMALDFSDNEGNTYMIKALNNLRQNQLETDVMRVLRNFGKPKQQIAVIASSADLEEMKTFNRTLAEFFQVDYLDNHLAYLPPVYQAVLVVNPAEFSTEFMLALEQYVLNGGSLILFTNPDLVGETSGKPLIQFLNNFGISPLPLKTATLPTDNPPADNGTALPVDVKTFENIRAVFIDKAGLITLQQGNKFATKPLLTFGAAPIAALSQGQYISNYLELAGESEHILPMSAKDGKVFFIYDSDILKDTTYVSPESKGNSFYEAVPEADNLIFLLKILDEAAGTSLEEGLHYKHYIINKASIGHILLASIRSRYEAQIAALEAELSAYQERKERFYQALKYQQSVSMHDIGNINELAQNIDKTEGALYALKSQIANDYHLTIAFITVGITLFAPLSILLLFFLTMLLVKRFKSKKIRRLMQNAETH